MCVFFFFLYINQNLRFALLSLVLAFRDHTTTIYARPTNTKNFCARPNSHGTPAAMAASSTHHAPRNPFSRWHPATYYSVFCIFVHCPRTNLYTCICLLSASAASKHLSRDRLIDWCAQFRQFGGSRCANTLPYISHIYIYIGRCRVCRRCRRQNLRECDAVRVWCVYGAA